MRNQHRAIAFALVLVLFGAKSALAQRIRFPQNAPAGQATVTDNPLTPVLQQGSSSRTLGPPTFDPYSTNPNAAATAPSLLGPPGTSPSAPSAAPQTTPFWQTPPNAYPSAGAGPTVQIPGTPNYQLPVSPGYQAPATAYPQGGYAQQPGVLFPNGLNLGNWTTTQGQAGQYLRLFQDVRMTYTWLNGKRRSNEMESNDVQIGTTMNIPNFFFSGQPIRISPEFIFHFWDGPVSDPSAIGDAFPGAFPTELPSRVYSTYLNFGWDPVITPQLGADLEASVGVYSDFDNVTTDSIRYRGTGLLVLGLTPTVALKGGVTYLDRLDIKLLPAGGILWRPNPQTYFDIYFPKPKLAQYLYTVGNTDVWWYLMAEYGGGSWTMDRLASTDANMNGVLNAGETVPVAGRVDVNDIRAGIGLEWTCQSGLTGLFEVAYVFNRELVFEVGPPGVHKLKETIMLRGGITY